MNTLYWIWLQCCLSYGSQANELLSYYGDAKNVYDAGENSWRLSGLFARESGYITAARLDIMKKTPLERAEKIMQLCSQSGVDIITPDSELYPQKLRDIKGYPLVLYVRGDMSCLENKLAVAVIGGRKPSVYGIKAAEVITGDLAMNDTVIISGGALGIDSVAHKTAVEKGGKTILVMGCGHDTKYLAQNEPLRGSVAQNGAVITEYPPRTPAGPGFFPLRNRIISGLSEGIVVVEAREKSGTLNTVSHAQKQGRDIFVVPGDISSATYKGSNMLISKGAHPVFSGDSILRFYGKTISVTETQETTEEAFIGIDTFPLGKAKERKSRKKAPKNKNDIIEKENKTEEILSETENKNENFSKNPPEGVSDNANIVYNHMLSDEMSLDDIKRSCSLPVRTVLTALTELEIAGAVKSCGAGRYSRL